MKIKKTKLAITVCCLGSLVATNVGRAALTDIFVHANSGVSGLTSTAYNTIAGEGGGGSSTWAGNWTATITGGFIPVGAPAINTPWQTFCMDIDNSMFSDATYRYTADAFVNGNPPANNPPDPRWVAGGGAKAGYLYGLHLTDMTTAVGATAQAIARSALCIAIWEVLYESDTLAYSVSSHSATKGFQVSASGVNAVAAVTMANTWLSLAVADGFDNPPESTWWRESAGNDPQSLIGVPSAVPEPGTYLAGGLLLLPFLVSTLRRRFNVS